MDISYVSNADAQKIRTAHELAKSNGYCDLTKNEISTLISMVSLLNFQKPFGAKYLEIGIYGGGTIRVLNHFIPTVEYTGIDLFEDFQASADNTHDMGNFTQADVQQFLGPAVRLIKGDSQIVLPALHSVGEKFDFIFIDGNHTYAGTKVDLENSIPMLAPGAYIALHNCSAWGTPEIDAYNRVDGGPFRVCVEMKTSGDWICVYEIDRLCVFTRRNTANG